MKEKLLGDVVTANEFAQLRDDTEVGCLNKAQQFVSKFHSTNRTIEIIDDMIEVINEEIEKLNSHITREEFEELKKDYIKAKNKFNNRTYHLQHMIDSFHVFIKAGYIHSAKEKLTLLKAML